MHSLFANSEWPSPFLNLFKSAAIRRLSGRIYPFQKDNDGYLIRQKRTNDRGDPAKIVDSLESPVPWRAKHRKALAEGQKGHRSPSLSCGGRESLLRVFDLRVSKRQIASEHISADRDASRTRICAKSLWRSS